MLECYMSRVKLLFINNRTLLGTILYIINKESIMINSILLLYEIKG